MRGSTEGREKFATGGVTIRLWYTYHGANRSYPVTNFSPVKKVNINDPWYNLIKHYDHGRQESTIYHYFRASLTSFRNPWNASKTAQPPSAPVSAMSAPSAGPPSGKP